MKSSKKKTIFKLFLIPLTVVMLIQGAIILGSLVLSRASGALKDYSVGMMYRTVENRKVILQNEMIQRWSSVNTRTENFQQSLSEILRAHDIGMEQFLESGEVQNAFLEEIFPECVGTLRSSTATGLFVVLANQQMDAADCSLSGIYIRDADPHTNPDSLSDLLMERGSKQLSKSMSIPLDSYWSTQFHFGKDGTRGEDNFFYKPCMAGKNNPDAKVKNLGYWSTPFFLEANKETYERIAYSVPLIYEGTVYGVLGVEISYNYLQEFFPLEELQEGLQAGYMLVMDEGDGTWSPITGTGILYERILESGQSLKTSDTGYDSFYQIKGGQLEEKEIYATARPLRLYNDNTPFSNSQWMVVGLNTGKDLFGIGNQMYYRMVAAICVGLLFGVICVYFLIHYLTMPIKRLMECISSSSGDELQKFRKSDIVEVDGLYDVVKNLTDRQKEAEDALVEEKERYRLALESSKDTFFTYDLKNKDLDIFNTNSLPGKWNCGNISGLIGIFKNEEVYPDDREKVKQYFRELPETMKFEMRLRLPAWEGFRWLLFSGRLIYDSSGSPSKLVGSLRNIQEQKLRELQAKERASIDSVTSLYTRRAGTDRICGMRKSMPEGVMVLMDLDQFRQMDEQYGIVFGDTILEELGRVILTNSRRKRNNAGQEILALRFGGDEFLIWLPSFTKAEAEAFLGELYGRISMFFGGSSFHISITSGAAAAKSEDTMEMLEAKAVLAQKQARMTAKGTFRFYDERNESTVKTLPDIKGSQIVSLGHADRLNMVSLTLNFFDKGGDIDTVMTVLLMKLGRYYGASDIMITILNRDFRTSYMEYQWHDNAADWINSHMRHYTTNELERFAEWNKEGSRQFGEDGPCPALLCKFLMIKPEQRGVAISMIDSGNYVGSISFVGTKESLLMSGAEKKNLREIGTIIQNSLNRERHDLASQAKTEFLSRMSHEIRTPMNGIIGMTEIALQNGQKPERVLDCLNKIRNSSDYLLGLINDILDMSKIESGKMRLEHVDFLLPEMLDDIRELIEPQARAKKITYIQDVKLKNDWFYGDRLRISQVLINLLGNAVKFTDAGGTVQLKVTETAMPGSIQELYFEVEDNGIGISPEDQDRVFSSFEQAEGSVANRFGGTGLGLAISNRLVQLMDGEIKLESNVGQGSRFYFYIRMPLGKSAEKQSETAEELLTFEGRKVLLVEDNALNAEIAQVLLENYKFIVDWVENGKEAVERISSTAPGTYDLIMMDIRMPVMDGLEATKAIRAMERTDTASIPIVAMTANAFDEDMKKSIECGMNGHLAKPVDIRRLQKLLKQLFKE